MNYQKQYADKINWKNSPDTSTPLNATNLNKMDNALWYMDGALYMISEAIGGGSSARGGIISNVGNNEFTTHIHQRTGESLAENELLILRSDVSGTGNSINIYTDSSSAAGFGFLDLDGESTSITVTTDSVVVLMITDADTDYTAQVLAVIDVNGANVFAGLGIGKKTGVSSNVINTDIDLRRSPMVGDRLLVYFDKTVQSPTGLKTYNNGVAVTSNLENVTPLYINAGWNILQFMNDGLLYNNCWVRKQNVPVPSTLAGMSDTLIVSPSDDQLLVYDNGKWKNKKFIEANVGFPVTELRKIEVDGIVYDTDGMRTYEASNVANNNITLSVLNAYQFVQKVIAINTGTHSGSSSAWNLVISDGMEVASVALKNADGSPFADDIHENELLFVYVDTAGNVARVLEIHSHDLEVLKDICITEKTATGNPVTITDGLPYNAVSLTAEIELIQDLHGQSAPYVGGAGKNKLPMTVEGIKAANSDLTWNGNSAYISGITWEIISDDSNINVQGIKATGSTSVITTLQLPANVTFANDTILTGCPTNGGSSSYQLDINAGAAADTGSGLSIQANTAINSCRVRLASGYACPSDGLMIYPMLRLSTESDASFAPYSNICPISGRTAVAVNVSGHNVWDEQWEVGKLSDQTGEPDSANDRIRTKNYIPIKPDTDYFAKVPNSNVALYIHYYDENYNHITSSSLSHTTFDYKSNRTTHSPTNARYMKFGANGAYGTAYHNDISISYPNSLTDYVPYVSNKNYTILLSQTTYGDSVAIVKDGSGWKKVETIGHGMQTLTRNLTWRKGANPNTPAGRYIYYFTEGLTGCKPAGSDSNPNNLYMKSNVYDISNTSYGSVAYKTYFSLGIGGDSNIATIGINTAFSEGADFLTWLDNNPVQIWYPLATPQVIETSITVDDVIQMLSGYNTLYADSGALTLTYKADRLAAIEAALEELSA